MLGIPPFKEDSALLVSAAPNPTLTQLLPPWSFIGYLQIPRQSFHQVLDTILGSKAGSGSIAYDTRIRPQVHKYNWGQIYKANETSPRKPGWYLVKGFDPATNLTDTASPTFVNVNIYLRFTHSPYPSDSVTNVPSKVLKHIFLSQV